MEQNLVVLSVFNSVLVLKVFLFLFLVFIHQVINSEDVLGIDALLHTLEKIFVELAICLLHESLSQFANSVMVGNASSVFEYSRSRLVLDVLVNFDNLFFRVFIVTDGKVDVNGGTSLVQLRDSEADEHVISVLTMELARLVNCFFNILAEILNVRPGARSLETFSHLTICHAKIANISNHICQLITLDSIFSAARNSFIFLSNLKHLSHLSLDFIFLTLEKASRGAHLISLEADHFQKELFLDLINDLFGSALLGRFNRLSKLELNVVEQA